MKVKRSPDIGHLLHEELVRVLTEGYYVADPEKLALELEDLAEHQIINWATHLANQVAKERRRS